MSVVERIILWPDVLNLSGSTNPVIRCNFNFREIGDKLKDAPVKFTVYCQAVYQGSELGDREFAATKNNLFTQDDGILSDETFFLDKKQQTFIPGTILNPITGKGTGVLTTMDGFIRRVDRRVGRPWFFTPTRKDEFTGDSEATILVATPNAEGEHVPLVNLNFPTGDLQEALAFESDFLQVPRPNGAVLLFRMALTGDFGGLKKGLVIASSANPRHCPAAPGNLGGVLVTGARDPKSQSVIGADGGKRPVTAQSATARSLDRDLTGLYEAEPIGAFDASQDPPMMVHIHQAGHSLVGWFSPPRGTLNKDQKPLPSGLPQTPGCFESYEPPDATGARTIEWFEGKRPKPDLDPTLNVSDPDDLNSTDAIEGGTHPGQLKIVGKFAPNDLTQEIELTFFDVPPKASGVPAPKPVKLLLKRVGVRARLPFYILKDFRNFDPNDPKKNDLGAAMVAEQVTPIPLSFWTRRIDRIEADLTPIANRFIAAGNDGVRKIEPREAAANLMTELLGPPLTAADRVDAAQKLRALLNATKLKVADGGTVEAIALLNAMVASEMDAARKNPANSKLSDQELYRTFVDKGFQTLGIGNDGGRIFYTLTFKSKDAPIKSKYVIQFGLSAFELTIKKEIEVEVKDATGTVKTVRKPDGTAGWIGSEEKKFFGLYGEGGVAAGWDFANMKLKSGKPGAKPGTVEIQSFLDIPSVSDFDGADFSVTALKLGSLSTPVGGVKLIDSAFLQFHLPASNGFLDAVVETNFDISSKFDKDTLKTAFDAAKKETPDLKELVPSASIISLTQGWGKIFLNPDKVAPPPPREQTTEEAKRQVKRTTPVTFDVDSAELTPFQRRYFEWMLAMDRALYTSADGDLVATGFASPEASKDHNLKLSQARAFTVMQAVQDAFGADLTITDINRRVDGLGEDPGEDPVKGDGLLDPEAGPPQGMTQDQFKSQILKEQKGFWPRWRRVDLLVNGVVSVRVMGRGARSD